MPDFVSSPGETIRQRFSLSLTGGQNEPPIPPFSLGAGGFPQESIPPPVSQEEIQRQFAPLIQDIEGEAGPTPRDVPSRLNPWMVFAGALASNMGSSLSRNPIFAQQFAQQLQDEERRRQALQDENYANQLLFSKEKRTRLFAVRGQALETALSQAIQANETERAAKIAENIERLRKSMEEAMLPKETAAAEHKIRVSGQEERKAIALRAAFETETKKAEAAEAQKTKPLTMDQYQDNIRQAMVLKPEQLQTQKPTWLRGFLGIGQAEERIEKGDVLERIHAEAASGGDTPAVKSAARANLVRSIAKRLGIKNPANMNDQEAAAMKDEFVRLGVPF